MSSRKSYIINMLKSIKINNTTDEKKEQSSVIIKNIANLNIYFISNTNKISHTYVKMDDCERARHYRICHAIAKQYDLYPEMRGFMREQWQKSSMRELEDQELQTLLTYMRNIEKHSGR